MNLRRLPAAGLVLLLAWSPLAAGKDAKPARCCCKTMCRLSSKPACHGSAVDSTWKRSCPMSGGSEPAALAFALQAVLPLVAGLEAPRDVESIAASARPAPTGHLPRPPTPPPKSLLL